LLEDYDFVSNMIWGKDKQCYPMDKADLLEEYDFVPNITWGKDKQCYPMDKSISRISQIGVIWRMDTRWALNFFWRITLPS
jgi:hypothetical protein